MYGISYDRLLYSWHWEVYMKVFDSIFEFFADLLFGELVNNDFEAKKGSFYRDRWL
jgi:hypothetical protein